MVSMIPKN